MTAEINTQYTSYVHISNSGYAFAVEVNDLDSEYGATQRLGIELHAFGLTLDTTVHLDDNVLDALEYILGKAREQRKAFRMSTYNPTDKAVPPHSREDNSEKCSDSSQES